MTKTDELLHVFAKAVKAGGGIHSAAELAFMLGGACDSAFSKFLAACVNKVRRDFNMEMSRFIPKQIKERTLDNPDYWAYVQGEVKAISSELVQAD